MKLIIILAVAFLGLALAACDREPEVPALSISAGEYSFDAPDTIAGGVTRLRITNNGKESHHAQLVRLNDGVTSQQFQQAFDAATRANFQGPAFGQALALVSFQGGAPPITPGKSAEALFNVPQGQYMMVCFVPGADGVPHAAKGMVKPLTVGPAPAKQPGEPKASVTVSLNNFRFDGVPAEVKAGKATWAVVNAGAEPHEMGVLKLKVPAAQFKGMFSAPPPPPGSPSSGPPPFEEAGGFQALMPGGKGWAVLDLEKGDYGLICFVPSPANQGKEHAALGMVATFVVK